MSELMQFALVALNDVGTKVQENVQNEARTTTPAFNTMHVKEAPTLKAPTSTLPTSGDLKTMTTAEKCLLAENLYYTGTVKSFKQAHKIVGVAHSTFFDWKQLHSKRGYLKQQPDVEKKNKKLQKNEETLITKDEYEKSLVDKDAFIATQKTLLTAQAQLIDLLQKQLLSLTEQGELR